jgi:hypothetical protein
MFAVTAADEKQGLISEQGTGRSGNHDSAERKQMLMREKATRDHRRLAFHAGTKEYRQQTEARNGGLNGHMMLSIGR